MKRSLILLIFVVATVSCKKEGRKEVLHQQEGMERIPINPTEAKDWAISELYESVDFIPIISNSQVLIHDIGKVREIGDTLIIMTERELWFIDNEGNILNKIEAIGQGPGEYEVIYDLLIDAENKTAEILDGKAGKIIKFGFNGEFLGEWKNKAFHMARSFGKISDDVYALYGGTSFEVSVGYRLLYASKRKDQITEMYFPIGKEARFVAFLDQDNFWQLGGNVHFSFTFQDMIYRLGEGGPEAYLGFDYGEYSLPEDIMERDFSNVMEFIEYCRQTSAAYQAANFFETEDRLFFTFEHKSRRYQGYYYKSSGEVRIVSGLTSTGENELADELFYFLKYPKGAGENRLYFEIEPYEMIIKYEEIKDRLSEAEWEKLVLEHKPLLSLYRSLEKDDSNILVKAVLHDAVGEN